MQAISLMRALPRPTLVVTMVGTLGQWKDALYDFGGFRPLVVNPSFTGRCEVQEGDVVLTTYSSFQKVKGVTPIMLTQTRWGRIVLDEGHVIRNDATRLYKELSALHGECRWVLSGTPIQNKSKDIKTLARWVGLEDELVNNISEMVEKYVLRRTQQKEGERNPRMALPGLCTLVHKLQFKYDHERDLYRNVEEYFREKVRGFHVREFVRS